MVKIGLEVHGYIVSREKLFCDCLAEHGAKHSLSNTNICSVCTGQPGAKPMLPNKVAIDKAIMIGLILGCKINNKMSWQRKHYSWPDLPKGYQNTLSGPYAIPVGEKGNFLGINITECHLEEDPASWNPETGEIDYNRSGSPLIEIVTEPDFKNSEQVVEWLEQLVATLSYVKAIDKKLGVKADVNVSISGGERVEIKNVNSLKKIKSAIEYEIKRQEKDIPKIQETRMFDESKGITKLMRTKENAQDYRFISDPDLPVVKLEKKRVEKIKKSLPMTPSEKLNHLIKKYKIDEKYAKILIKNLDVVDFFEKVISRTDSRLAVRWITEELFSVLNYNKKELEDIDINVEHFIELLNYIKDNKISELQAKDILRSWKEKSESVKDFVSANAIINDSGEIVKLVRKVISENKKAVDDYQNGEAKSMNFLVGQVMRLSNKRADFKTAREILEREMK